MEILINHCFGGLGVSDECANLYFERTGKNVDDLTHDELRCDPEVIKLFKEYGSKWCSASYSRLALCEIPLRLKNHYEIGEYDGMESVDFHPDSAIAECTRKYICDPTSENLTWLIEQISEIDEAMRLSYELITTG